MRIALLTAHLGNPWPNIGDYFITRSLGDLLPSHECVFFPLHARPSPRDLARLRSCERIVIAGTNLIGAVGTVRCGYTIADFKKIGRPVIPLALGGQADLGGRVRVDRQGRDLLAFWLDSAGRLSVRDRLAADYLAQHFGPESFRVTGCSTLFISRGADRIASRTRDLFAPGPYLTGLNPWRQGFYRALTAGLYRRMDRENETTALIQQPDGLRFRLPAKARRLFAPDRPEAHVAALAGARRILSLRIHPLAVAAAFGVPGLLIALDERTKSLAETMGLPFITVDPRAKDPERESERIFGELESRVTRYPWDEVARKMASLRQAFLDHLVEKGLTGEGGPAVPQPPSYTAVAVRSPSLLTILGVTVWKRLRASI